MHLYFHGDNFGTAICETVVFGFLCQVWISFIARCIPQNRFGAVNSCDPFGMVGL